MKRSLVVAGLSMVLVFALFIINSDLVYANPGDYKENKALSNFLNEQGFKLFNEPNAYIGAYSLPVQREIYGERLYWFDKNNTVPSMDGTLTVHPIPSKNGSFVVYAQKKAREKGTTEDLVIYKFYADADANVTDNDIAAAFLNKYGRKDNKGKLLKNQYLPLHIKHKDFYLDVTTIVRHVYDDGKRIILIQVQDQTYPIKKYLESQKKSNELF